MKKDLLMVIPFTNLPNESGNSRFLRIASMVDKTKFNLEIVTSSFWHTGKVQRDLTKNYDFDKVNVTLLNEPGYKKNISIMRLISHRIFSKNVKKHLRSRKNPDLIYCSVPSLSVAKVVSWYTRKNKRSKLIIDIQDLWPEAFKMVITFPVLNNILFYWYKKVADYIYSSADEIIAVSETYAKRALSVNKKTNQVNVIYLGTDLNEFDIAALSPNLQYHKNYDIWLAYVGTLGSSYDLEIVFKAINSLNENTKSRIQFVIMGDGPMKHKFKFYAQKYKVNSIFTGYIPYEEMVSILCKCDIAVNPIAKNAAQSIINKVGDYAAAKLPVLNTQENMEYRDLVKLYNIGYNCRNNDSNDLSAKLQLMIDNMTETKLMGLNNRSLAEERFDRSVTYKKIVEIINRF